MNNNSFEKINLVQNEIESMRVLRGFQDRFDVWGHGVASSAIAGQIMKEGLRTDWKAVHDIAHKLPDNEEELKRKIRHWDYNSRRFIVLIVVPKGLTFTDVGGSQIREKSIESSQEHVFIKSEGGKNVIPPSKIAGYFDANNFSLVANPNFE